jgi:hypothetical protein
MLDVRDCRQRLLFLRTSLEVIDVLVNVVRATIENKELSLWSDAVRGLGLLHLSFMELGAIVALLRNFVLMLTFDMIHLRRDCCATW